MSSMTVQIFTTYHTSKYMYHPTLFTDLSVHSGQAGSLTADRLINGSIHTRMIFAWYAHMIWKISI